MTQKIENTLLENVKEIFYTSKANVKLLSGQQIVLTNEDRFYDSDIETKFNILYNQEYLLKYFTKKQILKAIKDSKVTLSDLTTYSTITQKNEAEFDYTFYKRYLPIRCYKQTKYATKPGYGQQLFPYTEYEFTCLVPSFLNDIKIVKELLKNKCDLSMCDGMYLQMSGFHCYINMPIQYELLNGRKENIKFSVNLDELTNKNTESAIENTIKRNLEYIYSYYYEYKVDKTKEETKEILTNMVKDFFEKQK